MSASQLLPWVGILIPTASALLIAYWHRKQMRQNELYRADPSVGLVPPPTRLWAFVKSNRILIVGVGLPLVFLTSYLLGQGPVTRLLVLAIAANLMSIGIAVNLWLFGTILGILKVFVKLHEKQFEIARGPYEKDQKELKDEQGPRETGASGTDSQDRVE